MFEKSESLEALAKTVISENADLKDLDNPSLRIVYMYCDKDKTSNGKKVYADTTKLNDKTKAVAGCDFIITFYKLTALTMQKIDDGKGSKPIFSDLFFRKLIFYGFRRRCIEKSRKI